MADHSLFDRTYRLLGKSMDLAARRHSLIAGNIANMDTVGYQPKDMDFQAALNSAMTEQEDLSRTHPNHLNGRETALKIRVRDREGDQDLYHRDSVDIDTEMMDLIENNGQYRVSAEFLLRKIGLLKQAISEGGR